MTCGEKTGLGKIVFDVDDIEKQEFLRKYRVIASGECAVGESPLSWACEVLVVDENNNDYVVSKYVVLVERNYNKIAVSFESLCDWMKAYGESFDCDIELAFPYEQDETLYDYIVSSL